MSPFTLSESERESDYRLSDGFFEESHLMFILSSDTDQRKNLRFRVPSV